MVDHPAVDPRESTVRPNPTDAAVYRSLFPVFSGLYDALVPAYTQLRRLDPVLRP